MLPRASESHSWGPSIPHRVSESHSPLPLTTTSNNLLFVLQQMETEDLDIMHFKLLARTHLEITKEMKA